MNGTAKATLMIDNDDVRITRWDFEHDDNTGFHRHELPYVIVPLANGTVAVSDANGAEATGEMRSGEPYHRPAMAEGEGHDVRSTTAGPFSFLEIELKVSP